MPLTTDIAASYRGPGRVVRRLLGMGENEARLLAFVMGACAVMFIAQWPRLAREAHESQTDLNPLLGGALMGWILIAPLFFYLLAWLSHMLLKLFGAKGSGYGARLALFWALIASSPLFLLLGLTTGFVGAGIEQQIVGALWFAVFLWFWVRGLTVAMGNEAAA